MIHLTCPICGESLAESVHAFSCPRRHCFDIAREGYVNLLPPRGKKPKFAGDSAPMLRARRAFLERGHYLPLADAIYKRVTAHPGDDTGREQVIADIGSGEGWYIGRLDAHLRAQGTRGISCYGIDVSKDAVRLAAKRYRDVRFAVADVWERLPFGDESVDVLVNIFAPRNAGEFARVLAPGGRAIVAIPGDRHLVELRSELHLIGMEPDKREQVAGIFAQSLALSSQDSVEYCMELEGDDLFDLIAMTPNARHIEPRELARLRNRNMRVTASFQVLAFAK